MRGLLQLTNTAGQIARWAAVNKYNKTVACIRLWAHSEHTSSIHGCSAFQATPNIRRLNECLENSHLIEGFVFNRQVEKYKYWFPLFLASPRIGALSVGPALPVVRILSLLNITASRVSWRRDEGWQLQWRDDEYNDCDDENEWRWPNRTTFMR